VTALLAKSRDPRFPPDALTLVGHSLRVERAAHALIEALLPSLVESFGLDAFESEKLQRLVPLAALLHDVGKASTSFQATVTSDQPGKHPWRHELLSAGATVAPELLGTWLRAALDDVELALVAMMIAGHHLRADGTMTEPRSSRDEVLLLDSADLLPVWRRAGEILGLEQLPTPPKMSLTPGEGAELVGTYRARAQASYRRRARTNVLPLGKALVIAADIVGSAHRREDAVETWVQELLGHGLASEDLDRVVADRLAGQPARPFQQAVADSTTHVTVVTAGCGNGKTLAAYLWARDRAAGRRLAFCYPTTGTSTAGFTDYLLAQTDLERRLLHGRARVDVEAFESSPDDDPDAAMELWAPDVLDRWAASVVACTVDTVLGLMTNWRSALASLPLFTRCAFVFDEVHSYDAQLFGALLEFLRTVRAPTLVMTASLSPARLAAIREATGEALEPIRGDAAIESAPRYRIEQTEPVSALEAVVAAVASGENVLWVVNTVARAQVAYRAVREQLGVERTCLYHSRFRYRDRVQRQGEVLRAFRTANGFVVVATQVCEMSLDISADRLVTELAPFPSLVQRLGRLNRHPAIPSCTKPCLWYLPEGELPYDAAQLAAARELSNQLPTEVSQRDLAEVLERVTERVETREVAFHSQSFTTTSQPLRDVSVSWTVVRAQDLARRNRAEVIENAISMTPRRGPVPSWVRLHGALVVPDGELTYSQEEGASWAN